MVKCLKSSESLFISVSALRLRISAIWISVYPILCLSEILLSSDLSGILSKSMVLIFIIFYIVHDFIFNNVRCDIFHLGKSNLIFSKLERLSVTTSIAESTKSEVKNLSKVESFSMSTSALKSRISDISVSVNPSECLSDSLFKFRSKWNILKSFDGYLKYFYFVHFSISNTLYKFFLQDLDYLQVGWVQNYMV